MIGVNVWMVNALACHVVRLKTENIRITPYHWNESHEHCHHWMKCLLSLLYKSWYIIVLSYFIYFNCTVFCGFQTKHHVYGRIVDPDTEETVWSAIEESSTRPDGPSVEENLWTNVENAKGTYHTTMSTLLQISFFAARKFGNETMTISNINLWYFTFSFHRGHDINNGTWRWRSGRRQEQSVVNC